MSADNITTLVVAIAAFLSAAATYLKTKSPSQSVKTFIADAPDLTKAVESKVTSLLSQHGYVRVVPNEVPPAGTTTVPPTPTAGN